MMELLAGDFSKCLGDVRVYEATLRDFVRREERNPTRDLVSIEGWYHYSLQVFTSHCERVGLRLTAISLRDFLWQFDNHNFLDAETDSITMGPSPAKMFLGILSDALRRYADEAKDLKLLVVEPSRLELYEQTSPLFGKLVETQFPSLIGEISEIGKCLALGRSTASAFHSVRSLEAGIRAMSRCLGIADPTKGADRSWFNMLEKIKTGTRAKWPTAADRMSGDGQTFDELHGALAGMQNPYRNATAHLDQDYNDDEAKHIMELCKGLLMRIAKRMDEQGNPKA